MAMTNVEPRPSSPVRIDPLRDPAALVHAIDSRWRIYRIRAYGFGVVAGLLLGTIPAAIVTSTIDVILTQVNLVPDPSLPWPEVVWTLAFLVVFAASGAWAVARWLPAGFRAALESYLWLAVRAEAHWAGVVGAPVPRTAPAMRAFLDATPVTPATAGEMATIRLALGDFATAREIVATMPEATDAERHQKAATSWLVDFVGGADPSLQPLEASAALVADTEDRLEAQVEIAVDAARVALARNGDWIGPMAAVRPLLGPEPSRLLWRHGFRPAFHTMLAFGGIGVIAFWAFTLLT